MQILALTRHTAVLRAAEVAPRSCRFQWIGWGGNIRKIGLSPFPSLSPWKIILGASSSSAGRNMGRQHPDFQLSGYLSILFYSDFIVRRNKKNRQIRYRSWQCVGGLWSGLDHLRRWCLSDARIRTEWGLHPLFERNRHFGEGENTPFFEKHSEAIGYCQAAVVIILLENWSHFSCQN